MSVIPFRDARQLHFLNRGERRIYFYKYKGELTVLVNLKKPVIAYGVDGTVIERGPKGSGLLELGEVILYVLREVHEMDRQQSGADKYNRYLVEKRLVGEDGKLKVVEIELTEGEVKMIKERVGRLYLQSGIVGKIWDLLDGKE